MKETPSSIEEALFEEALDQPSAAARTTFLDEACRGNPVLRARLELLLEGHFTNEGFLTQIPEQTVTAAVLPLPVEAAPAQLIGRYKLLEKIGEGGFGEVWMAEQREPVKRRVALKILKLGMDTKQVIARFEAERQALAMMDHSNIAKIFDAGTTGQRSEVRDQRSDFGAAASLTSDLCPLTSGSGRPYFVMELVRGTKITEYCDQNRLPTEARLKLFIQVCHAIQHAHQKGIIHRDIKPSNILVTLHDGVPVPKVIDFGIAKATQHELTDKTVFTQFSQFIGTPAYISPEQAEMSGLDIDTRADIYSLGVLLYELLVGQTPFDAKEMVKGGLDAMRRIIREKEPVRPSTRLNALPVEQRTTTARQRQTDSPRLVHQLRGDLDWIVMKCIEKDRTRRYETANGLAMDVQRHLACEPIVARPPSNVYRMSKLVRRNPVVTSLGVLLLLALTAAIVGGAVMHLRVTRAKSETDRVNRRLSETVRFLESEKMEERAAEGRRSQPMAWLARRLRDDPTDRAAAARLLSMLDHHSFALPVFAPLQHEGKVHTGCFSPDGAEIMTAAEDGTVRFWDARDGRSLRVMSNSVSVASAGYFAGGKRLVVMGHDRLARVYDAREKALLFEVPGVRNPVDSYLEGGGGRWLFVEHANGRISRWDLQTGARLEPMLAFPAEIKITEYSETGACLAVFCVDNKLHIVDEVSGRPLAPAREFSAATYSIRFTPDGRRLFVSQHEAPRLAIWDYLSRTNLLEFVSSPPTVINSMIFTPDGRRLLTWTWDSELRIWDVDTLRPIGNSIKVGLHPSFVLSHDGRRAASVSQSGTTVVIDIERTQPLLEPLEHDGSVYTARFSANDSRLVTGSVDGTARVWDIRMRKPEPLRFPPSTGGGTAVFNRAGNRIIVSVEHNGVQVCDAQTARPLSPVLRHPGREGRIRSAWFSPDDSRFLTVGEEGLLRVWNAATFEPRLNMAVGNSVVLAKFSPDGRFVVAGDRNGGATVWSTETGQRLAATTHNGNEVVNVDFHPRGGFFITASIDGLARCWTLPDGQPATPALKHRGIVWSASYSPNGERIVTASSDKTAQIWNARTGDPLHKPLRHTKEVYLAVFSPDGQRVLTTSEDGTARVWNAETGEAVSPLLRHSGRIWLGAFSPDGSMVITGSDDRTVRFWDPETGLPMSEPLPHEGPVGRLSFSPDGRRLLSFGGEVKLWDVIKAPTPVPAWFCDLVEALAGFRQAADGQLLQTPPDAIATVRNRLATGPPRDFYSRWAKWFLVERMQEPVPAFRAE